MKVDTSKLKKSSSELTPECRLLIDLLSKCRSKSDITRFLETITVWTYGKCELYHWTHILDRFDKILEEGARQVDDNEFMLFCDIKFSKEDVRLLLLVLNFTTLLIEHSFSRHLYNSVEHLTQLLSSQNMDIVLAVLNLLYMFSKRSNFIPRLSLEKKDMLLTKLYNIAERWGDPNYGLALIDCCIRKPKLEFLYQLSIEYADENGQVVLLEIPDMVNTCKGLPISEVVKAICGHMKNPSEAVKMRIAHRIRLVSGFRDQKLRLQFVQARLQAISVLIYSNALQDNVERILYSGFGEELCELIDKEDVYLVEIRAAVLRTLTSMLHFDRNPNVPRPGSRLSKIIQYTGAERQGGILPLLVRDCITSLTNEGICEKYPLVLATSLFSLLYHLASYEAGGHALVKSGMMKSLLQVINWPGVDLEHITFVTRAVRVIDLITNIDIVKFHQCNGLNIFIDRMEKEINCCREFLSNKEKKAEFVDNLEQTSNVDQGNGDNAQSETFEDNAAYNKRSEMEKSSSQSPILDQEGRKLACVTQRAALLKSMLNFLKKSIQDHSHYYGMRNIMETSLPKSLQHIVMNAEYYGPSLYLLATDVVTVYIFNEPSLLSSLQETTLTNAIFRSLLHKQVPATREILGSLPNIFSALCLNERGLMEFMSYDPFDKFLRVLLSPDYLVAMRRRRSSDPLGDTSTNLGNAMDDLMKHHPYLRTDAIEAIVRLLHELVRYGSDSRYICWRAHKDNSNSTANTSTANNQQSPVTDGALELRCNENDSSGEDDEDDDEMSSASQQQQQQQRQSRTIEQQVQVRSNHEREAIPLIDYILNVMKFIDAIFSNSSNGDHCREFVAHGGLQPLLRLLSLPNLPIDSPVSTTAQAVANVCKSVLNLAHETTVIDIALEELSKIIDNLKPLILNFNFPGGSILLRELMACPKLDDGFSTADYTPLLHNMSSVHGYVVLLVHLCRNASSDMRLTLLNRWGNNSGTGLQLLQSLVRLYISLVWESTILLSLCSDEISETGLYDSSFGEQTADVEKEDSTIKKLSSIKFKVKTDDQLRYIKSLLAASSRLGRALAELFGTLVKLSVGTPQARQRRSNDYSANNANNKIPPADAKEIARVLSSILVNGFSHEDNASKPAPKLKLTFLICSVGFTGPMLFDDKRSCFHLMISQFCEENGLRAFFDMFYWALSLDNSSNNFGFDGCLLLDNILQNAPSDSNEYPTGTGEFIDAWLQLLEKMVNPRGILDSPYALSTKGSQSTDAIDFEPIFYLVQMHQLAMHVVRRIWKRKPIPNYGVSITETIMAILKHIIKSYNMICNKYKARLDEIQNADKLLDQRKKSAKTADEGYLNANHFKVLTDMGFGQQHVLDALRSTRSLEQATEFLLNHPEATTGETQNIQSVSIPLTSLPAGNDMDIDIDSASTSTSASASTSNRTNEPKCNAKNKQSGSFSDVEPLPNEIFNQFCNEVFERVFAFMEYLPETVNTGTELLSALYRQNNHQNKREFMVNLVNGVTECMEQIINIIKNEKITKTPQSENMLFEVVSSKLLIRLKVSTILLDENYSDIRKEFCAMISQEKSMHVIVNLLYETEALLKEQTLIGVKPQAPQWLQNFIEFIDAIDNVCVILQRRENMRAVCSDKWRWYDVSTGKWNSYTESNNNLLKTAFAMGEKSQVINIGRQRYTVNFNYMTQVSEASGTHRSVLPDLKISEAICALRNGNPNTKTDSILTRSIRSKPGSDGVIYKDEVICLRSLTNVSQGKKENENENTELTAETDMQHTCTTVVEEGTSFGQKKIKLKSSIKPSSKKSASGLSKHSKKIVLHEELVGLSRENCTDIIACLVHLLQPEIMIDFETKLSIMKLCARLTKDYENAKAFYENGGISLLLKMRQSCGMMEFPTYAIVIIRHVLEAPSVLQDSIERILTTRSALTVPVGHRDLVYFLTQVSSAVARHPTIFLMAAKQSLQADHALSSNFPLDESRFLIKSQTTNKSSETLVSGISKFDDASEETVEDLLRAIVQPCVHYGGLPSSEDHGDCNISVDGTSLTTQADKTQVKPSSSKKCTENLDINPCCCSWHIPSTSHTHQKPILPRSTLLKILSDAVRSYQCLVPRIIIEYTYTPADSPLITKPQSCISFILDHFLPITKRQQDPEVSMMSRVLLSSLSDCVSQPTVQSKLVEELHDAIVRTLTEPNYTEKHVRLQVLISLIPVMVESPMLSSKVHMQRNNMYRILLRQGIMTDLSKLAQYKDLSNSNTLVTVHSTLRPMEILLRLTITPGALSSRRIFFGTPPTGSSAVVNRRLYPRLTSRTSNENTGSVGGEHVLRDIIRNVLSDRRQAFDFILNSEDIFLDSEDPSNSMATGNDDNEDNVRESHLLASSNLRPQINFDQLWDDLLQNGHVAFLGRSSDSNNGPTEGNRIDTRNNRSDSNQGANTENGVNGGSDGASTSSELVAAVVDNSTSLLGEVSTSESESDSNASTENDRNDDDDDDEEDEDGNEEDAEDHSETDADEETRQFIEVFDHIYEPESSETASNDADDEASEVSGRSGEQVVNGSDADDETSEVTSRISEQVVNTASNITTENRNMNSSENREAHADIPSNILLLSEPVARSNNTQSSSDATNNISAPTFAENNATSREESSGRTNPSSVWIAPRLGSTRSDINYATNAESGSTSTTNHERIQNNATTVFVGSTNNSFIQRRESTRRLILLDQQYCTLMPSFNNPTEEGQLDIFNQDSLHWWLEESKHLDLESQTDACLYVAHLLIPFLIKVFKEGQKVKTTDQSVSTNTYNSPNRRSAIPVFIQQAANTNGGSGNASSANETAAETVTERDENTAISSEIQEQQDQISNDDAGDAEYSSEEENPTILVTNEDENIPDVEDDCEDVQDDNNAQQPTDLREVNTAFDIQLDNEMQTGLEQPSTEDIDSLVSHASQLYATNASVEMTSDNIVLEDIEEVPAVSQEPVVPAVETVEQQSEEVAGAVAVSETPPTTMNAEVRAALGDLQVPEGVDPSFLAALPAEMREEVINEHLRMQRIRQRAQQNAIQVAHDSLIEVNPEFLAALPPNIQTEVLMQQRIEQQRQAASAANPDDPVDTAAFFQNLPESLRQAILTDMEESQIASLPPDLAAEAQYLRRDWESRNGPSADTPHVLRRFPSSLQNLTDDSRWHSNSIWYEAHGNQQPQHHQHTTIVHQHQQQIHGKPIALLFMEDDNNMLDPDCLATILLFLFTEDTKINYTRFHRVIRNLCYHAPTRTWIINALISIIQKTNEENVKESDQSIIKPNWLKLRVDAAFGYKSNVFIINETQPNAIDYNSTSNFNISINPQAAQMVVKNCLDLLFVLARHFPRSFVPFKPDPKKKTDLAETHDNSRNLSMSGGISTGNTTDMDITNSLLNINKPAQKSSDLKLDEGPSTSKAAANRGQKNNSFGAKSKHAKKIAYNTNGKHFWDVLLKIDLLTPQRIANMQDFPITSYPRWEWEEPNTDFQSFNDTPFSKLLEMLPYKVICRSPQLTDMLVKLLASLSGELPKESELDESKLNNKFSDIDENSQGNTTTNLESNQKDESATNVETKLYATGYRIKNKLYSKNFSQLQLVTEVLTHQCGTVDGLDNISKLIVNLSQCSHASNAIFLEYLSSAVFGLAKEVRLAIQNLLDEIHSYKIVHNKLDTDTKCGTASPNKSVLEGIMQDRFTSENVIISAPTNFKPSCELQLPSIKKLLSPSSAQLYFLKTLKIFIQVREIFYSDDSVIIDSANKKPTLSQIISLQDLWNTLSDCLVALEESKDEYAVLVLQPTVEAFFLIHATNKKNETKTPANNEIQNSTLDVIDEASINTNPSSANTGNSADTSDVQVQPSSGEFAENIRKSGIRANPLEVQQRLDKENFLLFAEKHRTVLNQILRQSPIHLSDGPFAVLVDHTRILDFDVKRKYFQTELERIDEGVRREENTVSVRRVTVFEDSFRVLYRLGPEEWKNRFYIVFEDEEGQDAGGLLREWYVIISREIFNPMYALFCVSPGDRVTYMINPSSHANPNHLSYFKFVGRVIAKAIHDNKLLECYFTRSFYKHILGKQVKYTDMESQDYEFYKGLDYLMKNDISTLGYELTFSTEIQEFGVTQVRDLIPNGRNIAVTEENKFDYVQLVCQLKMSGSIRQQLDAFLEGFYDIIPKHLISIFNEQELELLISGLPDIDIEDLRANTEYHKYTSKSLQIQWFWRALRSFDQADRAKFLQFVTGTSKVPLQGFGSLEGMNGIQRFQIHRDDRSTDRLPCAHTCFNQLDLPMYKSYEKLRSSLLKAIHECSEGFGFA
ncbi:E3 ubiquitin-protein ligase HUWE1 isoform X2 [Ceratitis capitata]|uniref:E3 ubiquitin-protein ligase HUWE1 isoform X2 n=1 Tax=Ceratitis capitata TaxID=7213 RepID=UPI00032A0330|nr:E3 ubiquitin-protein ligase HUWE1 isoform X2 [Ceratitis capitata]